VTSFPLLSAFSTIHSLHDALHSTAFIVARNVVVFLAILFWLALAFWVFKDARRRIEDPVLVGVATLLGLFPPYLGPLVYLLFRPSAIESDFLACPVCATQLRQPCSQCDAPLEPLWQACPYCATPTGPAQNDLDAALSGEARAQADRDRLEPPTPLRKARVAES
jgi:Double zinc ribbon